MNKFKLFACACGAALLANAHGSKTEVVIKHSFAALTPCNLEQLVSSYEHGILKDVKGIKTSLKIRKLNQKKTAEFFYKMAQKYNQVDFFNKMILPIVNDNKTDLEIACACATVVPLLMLESGYIQDPEIRDGQLRPFPASSEEQKAEMDFAVMCAAASVSIPGTRLSNRVFEVMNEISEGKYGAIQGIGVQTEIHPLVSGEIAFVVSLMQEQGAETRSGEKFKKGYLLGISCRKPATATSSQSR